MEEGFLPAVQQAFREAANEIDPGNWEFKATTVAITPNPIPLIIVTYKGGNEYLDLIKLYKKLSAIGEIKLVEFRGRGREHEVGSVVVDFKFNGKLHQLHYILGA